MCQGFFYTLRNDVDFRVFLAKAFCFFVSIYFSVVVVPPGYKFLSSILLSFFLGYFLWNIFPQGYSFFLAVLLCTFATIQLLFPAFAFGWKQVSSIEVYSKSGNPIISELYGPLVSRPHEDITLSSDLPIEDFNATEFTSILSEKLSIPSTVFRIRIRSEKPFTFVLEVYQNVSGQGNSLVLNETIGRIVSEIRRLLSEQEDFRRFRTREQVEDFYQGEDDILGGEAIVELIYGPRITISGKNDICEGQMANITFTMDGTGPWNITYYDQLGNEYTIFPTVSPHTERIFINTSKVYSLESPEMHTPMENIGFQVIEFTAAKISSDRYCPAYVKIGTASVDVHPIPAAKISGGGIICEGESAPIDISLSGSAPWSIVYTDGESIFTKSGLSTPSYHFKSGNTGNFQILSVSSSRCANNTKSEIVPVRVNPLPTAIVSSGKCLGDIIMVRFTGEAPYALVYDEGDRETTISGIQSSPYIIHSSSSSYVFKNISDLNCNGKILDAPVKVNLLELPTATLSGGGSFFEGGSVELTVDLTGSPPWTFVYTFGNSYETVTTDTSPYKFKANKEGKYRINSVRDSHCSGVANGTATVTMYKLPSATIRVKSPEMTNWEQSAKICEGSEAQVRFDLSGSPPFNLKYTDGIENYTLNAIDDSSLIFNTRIPGVYRLLEIEDIYKNQVSLYVSATIETINLPTAKISAGDEFCEDESTELVISFTGTPPWFFVYHHNKKVYRETSINSSPHRIEIKQPGTYSIDTVGDRYCTNSRVQTSTTVTTKPIPNCQVEGGHVVGQDISVTCTGTAPFLVTFTEGKNQSTVRSEEHSFSIPTKTSGTYTFLEVSDGTGCNRALHDSHFVNELPKASIVKAKEKICEGESSEISMTLTGSPPWTIVMSHDGALSTISNITNSPFTYVVSKDGTYRVHSVSDANSNYGQVEGQAVVSLFKTPTASIEGGGSICQNEKASLVVHLTGTPPWTFTYTNGSSTKAETMVEKSPVTIFVRGSEMSGRIWIAEVSDANNCLGKSSNTEAFVTVWPLPRAHLSGGGVICVGSKTYLNLTLSGEAPWTVEYTDGEITEIVSDINSTPYLVEVSKPGTYYLTAITDQHCSYKRKK